MSCARLLRLIRHQLKTTKALGFDVPLRLFVLADQAIESAGQCRLLARSVSAVVYELWLLPEVKRSTLLRCGNGEK